jgi:hypothetical protein
MSFPVIISLGLPADKFQDRLNARSLLFEGFESGPGAGHFGEAGIGVLPQVEEFFVVFDGCGSIG